MSKKSGIFINSDYPFQDKSSVYVFSNEHIRGGIQAICDNSMGDLHGEKVLTVCASGDHALEVLYRGASRVDTFDINSYQSCIYELKTHFLRNCTYAEFLDFFLSKKRYFDLKMLGAIEHLFSPQLIAFLKRYKRMGDGRMLKEYGHNVVPDVSFLQSVFDYRFMSHCVPQTINFKHCDMRGLTACFQERYDVIILSNIFDYLYLDAVSYEEKMNLFYNQILAPLATNNLTDGGRISAHYMWGGNPNVWSEFTNYFQGQYITDSQHRLRVRCAAEYAKNQYDLVLVLKRQEMPNRHL